MKRSIISVFVTACFSGLPAISQDLAGVGQRESLSMFTRLTNPRNTPFRVGISGFEFGILISPKGEAPVLEYLRSASDSLMADTMLQMQQGDSDYLRYRVIRRTITPQTCPRLPDAISEFYSELEAIFPLQIAVDTLPPEVDLGQFYIEWSDYRVQIQVGEATLELRFPQSADPLQQAIAGLYWLRSDCFEGVAESIEEYQ